MTKNNFIILIASCALVALFFFMRWRYPAWKRVDNPRLEIMWTSVSDFRLDMLSEMSPIVIDEQLIRPAEAAATLLGNRVNQPRRAPHVCESLTAVYHESARDDELLQLEHPTNGQVVTVRLKRDQLVIVPQAWMLATSTVFLAV